MLCPGSSDASALEVLGATMRCILALPAECMRQQGSLQPANMMFSLSTHTQAHLHASTHTSCSSTQIKTTTHRCWSHSSLQIIPPAPRGCSRRFCRAHTRQNPPQPRQNPAQPRPSSPNTMRTAPGHQSRPSQTLPPLLRPCPTLWGITSRGMHLQCPAPGDHVLVLEL